MSALVVALTLGQLVIFEQPFEAPGSEATVGWTYTLLNTDARVVTSRSPGAGYLSDAGLRFEIVGGGGNVGSHILEFGFLTSGRLYTRGWARLTTAPAWFSPFITQATSIGSLGELVFVTDGGTQWLELRGSGPGGVGLYGRQRPTWRLNEWLQLELMMEGVGAPDASVSAALDGVPFETINTNWAGVQGRRVRVGFASGLSSAPGVIDLDEVIVATAPVASRLEATAVDAGLGCMHVFVEARATFDAGFLPQALPVDVALDEGRGVATPCAAPSMVTLTAIDTPQYAGGWSISGLVGFRFAAAGLRVGQLELVGAVPLDAGSPDAGSDAGAVVVPDAGQPDAGQPDAGQPDAGVAVDAGSPEDAGAPLGPPLALSVGCGCGAGGQLALLTSLAWVLCPSRRRRARGCR